MIQKIRIQTTNIDPKNETLKYDIQSHLTSGTIEKILTTTTYQFENITHDQAVVLAEKLLCESLTHSYTINTPLLKQADHVFEIAYKPAVMNPEVASIIKASHDLGIFPSAVVTSKEYGFFGELEKEDVFSSIEKIKLYNPIIEYIKPFDELYQEIPLTDFSDEQLMKLSTDTLFLSLSEMKTIQAYFTKLKRNPTDVELETIAQTWSEHCAHKTFKAELLIDGIAKKSFISRIKEEALKHKKNIVSAFVDNSGVIDFYDNYCICGKVETHNSPSAIEPYGGAMTGSGGVFRDIAGTGKGAKNIASTDIFCLAKPDIDPSQMPEGTLPPAYILQKVISGVQDYGNRMGIPTNNGSLHFHDDFRAKPTVMVGAYGLLPKKDAKKGKAKSGDLIVAIGGRTGRDGIHGATFSSGEMTDKTMSTQTQAVQIGNAIEEKRMFDALLEARDTKCMHALTDCGAGGFSSAIGEMGEELGVTVHLEKAPLKYEGLKPWEIWVSESQERMVAAIPKRNLKKFGKICKKYNVPYTVLGIFDGSKKLQLFFEGEQVCTLDMTFLHNGLPKKTLIGTAPIQKSSSRYIEPSLPKDEKAWIESITDVLSHGTMCSKEPIVRRYDHTVGGTNVIPPYSGKLMDGPNDAAVIQPFLDKPYGMILSHGLNPMLNRIDPYWGSIWACTEALANYAAVGGDIRETALINNYIWPFPTEEEIWSLDQSVTAVCDIMKLCKLPVISGKDSLSSTYRDKTGLVIKIPPVLCLSVFGKIADVTKVQTQNFKNEHSVICLVGNLDSDAMGGSLYFERYGLLGDTVPKPELKRLPTIFSNITRGIQSGDILTAHDISEGGLISTLFDMCIGGNMGAELSLKLLKQKRLDYFLFNETPGCFLIEVASEQIAKKVCKGIPYTVLGKTTNKKSIVVSENNTQKFSVPLALLKDAWQKPMKNYFPTL